MNRTRRCASVIAVASVVLGFFGSTAMSPVRGAATGVEITQHGFTIIGESSWRVVVAVDGTLDAGLNLDVISHRRVNTRADLEAALKGNLPDELDRLRLSVNDVPRNNAGRLVVTVPTASNTSQPDDLLFGTSGVYPVTIELRMGERIVDSTTTFVHRLDIDDANEAGVEGPLRVMNVAMLSAEPALAPTGESVLSTDFAAQLVDLAEAHATAERAITTGAFVSLQGDQSAAAGSAAFGAIREQLAQHTVTGAPNVPLNPSAMAQAGLGEIFASQLRAGEDAVASVVGSTPNRGVMVLNDRLTSAGAVLLRDVGVRSAILTPGAADSSGFRGRLDSALTYRARTSDGSTILLQGIDALYASVLGDTAKTPLERAAAIGAGLVLQRDSLLGMAKDLSLVAVALGSTDARPAEPDVLRQLFRFVGTSPVLTVLGAPRPAETETTGDVLELSIGADTSLTQAQNLVDQLTPRINNTLSMLRDDDPRRTLWPAMLTVLLSSRTEPARAMNFADTLRSSTRAVLESLRLPTAANFTLSSRKSELRLQVRNTSDTPLRAVVRFRSAKLKFGNARQVLEIPARASAEVVVDVEARSNGRFPVSVQLLTPRGDLALGEPLTITANVSALAGLGQVFTATALLILLTWWAHNWRSKRRRAIEEAVAVADHPSRLGDRALLPDNN